MGASGSIRGGLGAPKRGVFFFFDFFEFRSENRESLKILLLSRRNHYFQGFAGSKIDKNAEQIDLGVFKISHAAAKRFEYDHLASYECAGLHLGRFWGVPGGSKNR